MGTGCLNPALLRFSVPFSPWDGFWSLCWCSPTGRHQEALKHLQEAFGHCPAEDSARARLAVLQLQSRNVPGAAAPLSVLASRDEKDLAFLLNFVGTKQQQHLAQVQPFSPIPHPWIRWGKNWEAKLGLQGFLPALGSVWKFCQMDRAQIGFSSSQVRELEPNFSHCSDLGQSLIIRHCHIWVLGFLFGLPGDGHTEIQGVVGTAGRN